MAENSVWSAPISQIAKAICSTAAIKQVFEIVRGHRDLELTALRMHPSRHQSRSHDPTQRLKNDVQMINVFSRKSAFHDFLTRLYQGRLAQHAEEIKQSRERIQKGGIAKILQGTGMDKRQFFHHRERGAKWREYCKMFPDWVLLRTTDFDFLRRHLNTKDISALCCAGKKFEDSLDFTADDVEFVGESLSISLDKVSQTDLVSCLRPVSFTDEIIYDQNAYPDWPRPEDWPADWTGRQTRHLCLPRKGSARSAIRTTVIAPVVVPRYSLVSGSTRAKDEVCKLSRGKPAMSQTARTNASAGSREN
ncbi:hypothetical protein LTR41_011999 [Exophiala xenobiotica]|nr:hypothetical protein LTR41_011999 [Exophiala xenobiotica]